RRLPALLPCMAVIALMPSPLLLAQDTGGLNVSLPGREGAGLAYDSARNVAVLFGGSGAGGTSADTREWTGMQWTQRASTGPSARYYYAIVYDSARHVTVLFGGSNTSVGDTWEWDGIQWSLR